MINVVIVKGDFNNSVDGYLMEANNVDRLIWLRDDRFKIFNEVYKHFYIRFDWIQNLAEDNGGHGLRSLFALVRRRS